MFGSFEASFLNGPRLLFLESLTISDNFRGTNICGKWKAE